MSLVSISPIEYPRIQPFSGFTGFSWHASHQINGSGHRVGMVLSMPETCTITKLGIRINTCASAVTSRLGLYTVDSSGNPTTTLYGGSNYGTFTPAANTYSEVTLGTSCSAVAGDIAALMVDFDSTAGDMYLSATNGNGIFTGLPYCVKYNGSSWTRSLFGQVYAGHLYTSDGGGRFLSSGFPAISASNANATYNSGSTPDEYANKITLPFACRVAGLWHMSAPGSGAVFDIVLYDGTTVLESLSINNLQMVSGNTIVKFSYFDTPVEFAAGDIVYASLKPTTTNTFATLAAALFAAGAAPTMGYGSSDCKATRTDGGAWSDDTDALMALGLLIDQLDDGSGAGGFSGSPFSSRVFGR